MLEAYRTVFTHASQTLGVLSLVLKAKKAAIHQKMAARITEKNTSFQEIKELVEI